MTRPLIGHGRHATWPRPPYPPPSQALDQPAQQPPRHAARRNYAVRFMPANGDGIIAEPAVDRGAHRHPDVPPLAIADPRVRTRRAVHGRLGDGGGRQWRVVAGADRRGASRPSRSAVPLSDVDAHGARHAPRRCRSSALGRCSLRRRPAWFAVRRAFRPAARDRGHRRGHRRRRPLPARPGAHRRRRGRPRCRARSTRCSPRSSRPSPCARPSEERMRQFVADASHELRTPLATIRGYAELYRQGAVQRADRRRQPPCAASRTRPTRMGGLVEDLLCWPGSTSSGRCDRAAVDLTVLAADAVAGRPALDPTGAIRCSGSTAPLGPTVVPGDEARLRQVVTNLVANAAAPHPGRARPSRSPSARRHRRRAVRRGARPRPRHRPRARPGGSSSGSTGADASRQRGTGGGRAGPGHRRRDRRRRTTARSASARPPGGGATFAVDLPTANSQQRPAQSHACEVVVLPSTPQGADT